MNESPRPGYTLLISLVAAFGGFLFGYDTAIVSGAIGFFTQHFRLSAELSGWAASSLLVGCMVGAVVAGRVGDRFGRKPGLIGCGLLFLLSSIASALPGSLAGFAWARFAGGIAIGAASMLCPLYIAEVAPERSRGRLVSLYQLAIVVGIVVVYFVNLQIQRQGDEAWNVAVGWRWMFASLVAPSLLFVLLMLLVPESPRWLLRAGRQAEAQQILARIHGAVVAEVEYDAIEASLAEKRGEWSEVWAKRYRRPLAIGIVLAVAQQFCGINAVMYYAPEIFKAAGAAHDSAFLQTVIVGVVNLVFTFVAIAWVDRAGRKPLLLVGAVVQAAALGFVAFLFNRATGGTLLLVGILAFVAAFAMAMGPITWIIIAEIFPTKVRGHGMSVAILTLWFADWVVTQTFPMLRESLGPATTFATYAAFSLAGAGFVAFAVPETAGRPLEEIERLWDTPSDVSRRIQKESASR